MNDEIVTVEMNDGVYAVRVSDVGIICRSSNKHGAVRNYGTHIGSQDDIDADISVCVPGGWDDLLELASELISEAH